MVAYHMHPLSARWFMPIRWNSINFQLFSYDESLTCSKTKFMKEYDTSYYGALTD